MIKESRAIDNANIDGMQIFNSIDENSEVRNIVDTWIDYVACGLISLIHIFNPQAVIVGGGVSEQKDKFIIPLRKKVLTAVMPRFAENLHITAAKLGNKAGVYGAAQYCRTMIQEQK
jgi:glucokinase